MPSARNLYCHEREKRGGRKKSPLMATRFSFGKPTASQNVLSQSTEAASVTGAYRFRMSPIGTLRTRGGLATSALEGSKDVPCKRGHFLSDAPERTWAL